MKKGLLTISGIAGMAAISAAFPVNGGFELNSVGGGYNDVSDNWNVYRDSPDTWDNNGIAGNAPGNASYMSNVLAYEGTRWAALAADLGGGFNEGIESDRFFLSAGGHMVQMAILADADNNFARDDMAQITIRLRDSFGNDPVVGVLAANTANKLWELRSAAFNVVADGNYSLIISNEDLAARSYMGIDDVNMDVVPEPATMAILGLGVLGLARRRK